MPTWRLPDHVADVLPAEARVLEELRRAALDVLRRYGYELVQPPLLEYLDSLLTGTGSDLNLQTFKLVDQISGKTMGLRADHTPQTARIDAHLLNRAGITRLAYCGPVLHTRPRSAVAGREPLQLGAELYGYAGIEADYEMFDLMLDALVALGIGRVTLSVSHAGLTRSVLAHTGLSQVQQAAAADALQSKDGNALRIAVPEVAAFTLCNAILQGCGKAEQVLSTARVALAQVPKALEAIDTLAAMCSRLGSRADVLVDLADGHGYGYHTGLVFAAYVPEAAGAVVRGGRYDTAGQSFGRNRPATGFSLDLRELAQLLPRSAPAKAILAHWHDDSTWAAEVARLRATGEIVVVQMPGEAQEHHEFVCDRQLVHAQARWTLIDKH